MEGKKQKKQKGSLFLRILKWIGKGILILLLILSLIFQAPWKIITLLAVFFAACFILPKRMRKWFWRSVGAVVLILLFWVFLPEDDTGWRPYTFDEEIATFREKYAIPDEENATFAYYEIFENLNIDSNEPEFFTGSDLSSQTSVDKPWLSKDHPEMVKWLDDYQDIIQKLIQNSQIQKCRFILMLYDANSDQKFMGTLPKIRYSIFLLLSAANNDIAERRIDSALEKYFCAFRIADHLYQQPIFMLVLVNYAIKEKTLIPLNHFIVEGKPNQDQLKQIANLLNDLENNWSSDWHNMLDSDKLHAKNYFAGIAYEVNKSGKMRFSRRPFFENEQSQDSINNEYLSTVFGKIRAILRWSCFPSSPKKIDNIVDDAFEKHYTMAEPDFDWEQVDDYYINWKLNCRSVIQTHLYNNEPNYKQVHEIYLKYLSLYRGTRLLVAIRQYKNEHGEWPPDLDSIKTLAPTEAFLDPLTGEPLQYENHGKNFSLYGEKTNVWPR
jgi:hypothetical protein